MNVALEQAGGTVLAISADPPDRARQVAVDNKLDFPVLSDASRQAIRAYGVLHEGGKGGQDIALPANFLIDRQGRIVWEHLARRVQDRPHPGYVMAQVRRLSRED